MDSLGQGEISESSRLTSETSVEHIQACPAADVSASVLCKMILGGRAVKKSAAALSLVHCSEAGNELPAFYQGPSLVPGVCSQPQ